MAEAYVRDTLLAFSTIPEATYNTASTTDSDYTGIILEPVPLVIPQPEQTPVQGNTEFPADFCNGYFAPPTLSINPLFSFTGLAGRFGLQAHGSSVAAAQQGGTSAYKHTATLGTATSLKGRSFAIDNGDFSFLHHGMCVSTYAISQVGGQLPVVEVGLIGSGKYTTACPFTIPAATAACPAVPLTSITITDSDETSRNIYDEKVYSWRMQLDNGPDASSDVVRLGSDAQQGPTGGKAKYVGRVLRSQNRQVSLQVTVPVEAIDSGSAGYWKKMLTRESITSVTVRLEGDTISGVYEYAIDWTIADGRWTATPVVENNQILAYNLTLVPVHNATPVTFAVTNITTANYA